MPSLLAFRWERWLPAGLYRHPGEAGCWLSALAWFLAVIRSIHELVWAVIFVAAFGFSSLAAILAIAIPYGGILGRIYGERLADVPEEPLRALRASGASPLTVLIYGRIPMALPDLLSYTFYRFECAIRAAAIMSFVGIRGLGFENPTLAPGTAVFPGLDSAAVPGGPRGAGRPLERPGPPESGCMSRSLETARYDRGQRRPMTFARASAYLALLLAAASWGYILLGTDSGVGDLVSARRGATQARFFGRLLGIGVDTQPAYFQAEQWVEKGKLAYNTLAHERAGHKHRRRSRFPDLSAGRPQRHQRGLGRSAVSRRVRCVLLVPLGLYPDQGGARVGLGYGHRLLSVARNPTRSAGPGAAQLRRTGQAFPLRSWRTWTRRRLAPSGPPAPAASKCCCTGYCPRRCPNSSPISSTGGKWSSAPPSSWVS